MFLAAVIHPTHEEALSFLLALALGDVPVRLKRKCLAIVGNAGMVALDCDDASIARRMGKFSLPTPLARNLRFDLVHRHGRTGLEQLVADTPDRLFGGIAV
jgi:hypothetical protein